MNTVATRLSTLREDLRDLLGQLMQSGRLEDVNDDDGFLLIGPHYAWRDLTKEAGRIRSKLLAEYDRFFALVRALLLNQPDDTLSELNRSDEEIRDIIGQTRLTWHSTPQDALNAVEQIWEKMLELVDHLHDDSEGSIFLVPDTNALLYNPYIEDWQLDKAPFFTIILVPAVLRELDHLKINHRNPDLREKAESLVRRVKEYRGRGRLTEGVPLRKGKISIRAVAPEPDMEQSLPWLDNSNADDRLLASFIEIMRLHPRSAVVLLTRDINLQNKAEFARLAFEEPPEVDAVKLQKLAKGKPHNPATPADA